MPLRRVFQIFNGGTPTSNERNWNGELAWATPADLSTAHGKVLHSTARAITRAGLAEGSQSVPANSLILATRAPIGYVCETGSRMAFNQGCRGLVPHRDVDSRFFRYQLSVMAEQFQALGQGSTFMELRAEALAATLVAVPTLPEQRTIAGYLDTETARIDVLISKKRHLIKLLAEYRTALITQTVTRGLDPTVPHRPSGIDWLGDIPSHWQVRRLRKVCEFAYGDSLPSESRLEGKVPVFGSNGVVGHHNEANTLAPVIVIGRKGSHGEVNFHDASVFAIDTTYFVDARHTSVDLRWLYFGLLCVDLADESMDSAVPGLSREHAYGKCLPVPPIAEQREIADYLDIETTRIDALVSRIRSAIMLLEEYRSALITAAVTGEFDVPNRDTSVEEQ
ncbi:MAG: restriction endonuclease subunit S [Acidimicrobiaceae bacterium]|nr:restriction endonuclease subunit S [Acidimicrobiaceae bacterium]